MELQPLPPPPKNLEPPLAEPTELPEGLNFIDAIKRVLTESKPWVKYAPADKNQPTLAHKLREWGFISQPYFCERGVYRIGLFKQGFSSHSGLYLVISSNKNNEGAVVRLWPYHPLNSERLELILLYRSLNEDEKLFSVNMRDFEITSLKENYYLLHGEFFPELLNATRIGKPNFELTSFQINNAWGENMYGLSKYNPELVVKTGMQPPIHLPWTIDLYFNDGISLKFICPTEKPMRFIRNLSFVKVDIALGKYYYNGQYCRTSRLRVLWPQFSEFVTKFLAFWIHPKYKRCMAREGIDLVRFMDQLTPEPQNV